MEFLLLLSALFSALTGVATNGRAPLAVAQVAQVAVDQAAAGHATAASSAPTQTFDIAAARHASVPLVRFVRFDLPAYASRRRE